ncbi:ATP synthase mitochondrial F1 complex assembly factor 1 [Microplitis mediator]|uniref:ATP synthase mitochondrial F1 complex assembly factor 1 n=1 Tax=Microplitis mediator TaxID=375433 RepID=UPI0025526F77|nr:ATP synthase mitochondrial F1 complex assembly factor 1 [Microplitis mediator]
MAISTILFKKLINKSFSDKNILSRNIMTSSMKAKKFLENLKGNPYFDKYAGAIAKLQQTNPDEFLSKIQETENKKNQKSKEPGTFKRGANAKPSLTSDFKQHNKALLSDVMKLELLEDKGKQEITDIWLNYHKQKDCICGVMEPEIFDVMFEKGTEYPTFVLPLPRENGYEFILSQFSGTEVHMTPLIWYQTHQENAPECLKIIHYTDLRESKGLILMKGEFDTKSLDVQEAQCLANELQLYYTKNNPDRLKLLETFTKRPDEFKHMDLIAQLETITLLNDITDTKK